DLDLIAYGDMVNDGQEAPFLPHPRMAGRGFVLLPLRDVAPAWKHPVLGDTLATLIAALPGDQICTPID
ncbi:MAG: 2-amino-4-hydroxy-6-hydroxymethyldihydropteridine diphosphokinase, partial [Alphaproteobacteria bacterium]